MSRLALFLLGPPQIKKDGAPVQIPRRKALALIAYLAVTGKNHSRDMLATLFWPEQDQSQARASLRRALSSLRKSLGEDWLDINRDIVGLKPNTGVWLDISEFQDRLAECRTHNHLPDQVCDVCLSQLAAAVSFYKDDFLAGFSLRDTPGFDEWQFFLSEGLRSDLAGALELLVQWHSVRGEFEPAIEYTRRWLVLDNLNETVHLLLMLLYAWSDQQAAALRQYGECEKLLKKEFEITPGKETIQVYQSIKEKSDLPSPEDFFPTTISAPTPVNKNNLPAQLTPFVGRAPLLAGIAEQLQDPVCRLLTLVGPGGSGKTRLAIEAASAQSENYSHGVYFVSLAPLDSPEAIVPTMSKVLGYSFSAQPTFGVKQAISTTQQLLNYLKQKSMLIIMDNFEHLLDGVGLVTEILEAAPKVKILATSREILNVQGEHLFPIVGMDIPDVETRRDADLTPEEARKYSAVKFFQQSAHRVRPEFELTSKNLFSVLQICHLVQGMPLGILLATGWLEMLSPTEIAAEIKKSFDFLETEFRDMPERQRSVRAVFDHSWRILSEQEKEVFQLLSVFRGGFTQKAAKQITGASLKDIRGLVDKSLLQRDSNRRYQMHEMLRQYASEKLGRQPLEKKKVKDRHSGYFAGFLKQRQEPLLGREQTRALREIEVEFENVLAGWNWAIAQSDFGNIDRSLESFAEVHNLRGWFSQGEKIMNQAAQKLSIEVKKKSADRSIQLLLGKVLLNHGRFSSILELKKRTGKSLQKCLEIFRDLGARREEAYALRYLGLNASIPTEGKSKLLEALDIFKEIGDQGGILLCLWGLGFIANLEGEYYSAKQLFEESLSISKDIGNLLYIANSILLLGSTSWRLGEFTLANELFQDSLRLSKEINDRVGISWALLGMSELAIASGEAEQAELLIQESLETGKELGYQSLVADSLCLWSECAIATGDYVHACKVAHDSKEIFEQLGAEWRAAWTARTLGEAYAGLGNIQESKKYFHQSLQITLMLKDLVHIPFLLFGIAKLMVVEGEKEPAIELLALIINHPVSWQYTKDKATSLMAEIETKVPSDVVIPAQERGQARDLESTAAELLSELEG